MLGKAAGPRHSNLRLRKLRRIVADRSVRTKILIVPASLIALLLALGSYAFALLQTNEQRIQVLNNEITNPSLAILRFRDDAQASLSNLYRLTSVAANESDSAKLADMGKADMAVLDKLGERWGPL